MAGIVPVAISIGLFKVANVLAFDSALMTVCLGSAICYTTYQAWSGNDRARKILLILLSLHWGMIIFNNMQIAFSDVAALLNRGQRMKLYANMGRSAFWLIINYWYFLGPRAREFYGTKASGATETTGE